MDSQYSKITTKNECNEWRGGGDHQRSRRGRKKFNRGRSELKSTGGITVCFREKAVSGAPSAGTWWKEREGEEGTGAVNGEENIKNEEEKVTATVQE